MNFRPKRIDNPDINLTPLIDVVFLLLIFFMVSTTFTQEARLDITLPTADGLTINEFSDAVEIMVSDEGHYYLGEAVFTYEDMAALRSALALALEDSDSSLTISADGAASHQAVVTLMDIAGQVGYVNLNFTTAQPAQE